MHSDTKRFLFTAQAPAAPCAVNELIQRLPNARLETWLRPDLGLFTTSLPFPEVSRLLQDGTSLPPIFVRHICPVDVCFSTPDASALTAACADVALLAPAGGACCVQVRDVDGAGLFPLLCQTLKDIGILPDVQSSCVLSATLCDGILYAGVSSVEENLSPFVGGARRYAHKDGMISRAECKLMEATELFSLHFPKDGTALDLGAAPGGWTRVLRTKGLTVHAVDPALLSAPLQADLGIIHHRQTAQEFLRSWDGASFDLIVNDMKMDAKESARILCGAQSLLAPDGLAIMTLKLPRQHWQKLTNETLRLLEGSYRIRNARQLYHNRSEVTVVLSQRTGENS